MLFMTMFNLILENKAHWLNKSITGLYKMHTFISLRKNNAFKICLRTTMSTLKKVEELQYIRSIYPVQHIMENTTSQMYNMMLQLEQLLGCCLESREIMQIHVIISILNGKISVTVKKKKPLSMEINFNLHPFPFTYSSCRTKMFIYFIYISLYNIKLIDLIILFPHPHKWCKLSCRFTSNITSNSVFIRVFSLQEN